MPVQICTFDALADVVAEIEGRGDRLVSVTAANDSTCLIAYYSPRPVRPPKGTETR